LAGDQRDVSRKVEVFEFHVVELDILRHLEVHRGALSALGLVEGYA
jgi:phosphoenolpyruvate carboxylase